MYPLGTTSPVVGCQGEARPVSLPPRQAVALPSCSLCLRLRAGQERACRDGWPPGAQALWHTQGKVMPAAKG